MKNCDLLDLSMLCIPCFHRFKDHPTLNDRYLLLHLLGRGGFSEVYKVSMRNWVQRLRLNHWSVLTWRTFRTVVTVGGYLLVEIQKLQEPVSLGEVLLLNFSDYTGYCILPCF